jgi:hypothetical protein
MARTVAKLLGWILVLTGLAGFFAPTLLGAHLSGAHNIVHLLSGGASIWVGMASARAAKRFCVAFGLVYGLLGVAGFTLGTGSERMLPVIPGVLELGTMDHVIHVFLGVVYLVAGLATRVVPVAVAGQRA